MMRFLRTSATRHDDDGAAAVEYGPLVPRIAALIVAAVSVFGGIVKSSSSKTRGTGSSNGSTSASC